MDYFASLVGIMLAAFITNNIVLDKSIGICPFLGVSKKTSSAVGMGIAVTFVLVVSSLITYAVYNYLLFNPLLIAKNANWDLSYLKIIVFILVIAALVQTIEIILKKFSPTLYNAMGIYLPLITTNCAVMYTANFVITLRSAAGNPDFLQVFVHSLFVGLGFMLALVLMSGIRERLNKVEIAKPFKGFPIALLAAGIMSMAFIGLGGISFF